MVTALTGSDRSTAHQMLAGLTSCLRLRRQLSFLIAALVAVVASAALAQAAAADTLSGTVLHVNPRAHSFVMSGPGGQPRAVHAAQAPPVGSVVRVDATQLANGTWDARSILVRMERRRIARRWAAVRTAARHKLARRWASLRDSRTKKIARRWATVKRSGAKVRGTVTYVNPKAGTMTVSAKGVSLAVKTRAARTATVSAALPQPGDVVTADLDLRSGAEDLLVNHVEDHGTDEDGIELAAIVKSVDATARTLTVSADDSASTPGTVVIHVPDGFDLAQYDVGGSFEFTVIRQDDGSYLLVRSSGDDNATSANDPNQVQGVDPGQACAGQSKEHTADQPGTDFSRCVVALAHSQGGQDDQGGDSSDGGKAGDGTKSGDGVKSGDGTKGTKSGDGSKGKTPATGDGAGSPSGDH